MEVAGVFRSRAARRFIEARLALGVVSFSLEDLIRETGLSPSAATQQLRRLGKWVVKVSRKHVFYLIVSPEFQAIGTPPVNWWLDDYFRWLGQPYYLALYSAAEAYGAEPQALQVTQIMTNASKRDLILGRQRLRFFLKKDIHRTPTQQLSYAQAPLKASTPAATVLDLIRYASRIGGMNRAIETLLPLVPRIAAADLKQALQAEDESALGQRLGYIFERFGHERLARVVEDWLPRHPLWTPLVPGRVERNALPAVSRWHVLQNAEVHT